jgi:ATPase subunit of ABC transporter with duplicated ATPase domains
MLFKEITVKFINGNRYGLIGANGCSKSTFLKIFGDYLVLKNGNVFVDLKQRIEKLH